MYPLEMTLPMREEVTRFGVKELRTPEEVDRAAGPGAKGTALIYINSVCGCAGGIARPGIGLAMKHKVRPDLVATVFAGGDVEATARVRQHATGYPPSSPSAVLFRDGTCVWALQRHEIEGRDAASVAKVLTDAFDRYCAKVKA